MKGSTSPATILNMILWAPVIIYFAAKHEEPILYVQITWMYLLMWKLLNIEEKVEEVMGEDPYRVLSGTGYKPSLTSREQRLTSIEQQVKDVKGDHPFSMVEPTSLADIKREVMGELASIERKVDKVMEGK